MSIAGSRSPSLQNSWPFPGLEEAPLAQGLCLLSPIGTQIPWHHRGLLFGQFDWRRVSWHRNNPFAEETYAFSLAFSLTYEPTVQ